MEPNNRSPWKLSDVRNLQSFQLANVTLDLAEADARCTFVNEAGYERELVLGNLYQFSFSRHPDEDGPFVVDVDVSETEPGGKSTLKKLGFGFADREGSPASATELPLYLAHFEGDIVLDAVCGIVQLWGEVE